jgi:hypothetical protein
MLMFVCNYYLRTSWSSLITYWGNSVSSDVLYSYVVKKNYIPLSNLNSDNVVTSHKNRNFHLRLSVKSGALQRRRQQRRRRRRWSWRVRSRCLRPEGWGSSHVFFDDICKPEKTWVFCKKKKKNCLTTITQHE